MKIAIVVGTRPEIIKMAPLIHECIKRQLDYFIVHSNQHYSPELDSVFFKDLNLPAAKYNLNIGSGNHGNQTGKILISIEPVFEKEKPDIVFVQGDTNTTAAAGLAACKLGIKVAHVEAGLRSYDKRMPEETNRIMTDHLSDYLFAVSDTQKKILMAEGIAQQKIHVVGNTVVDTLLGKLDQVESSQILSKHNLQPKQFSLMTIHRASNVDSPEALKKLSELLHNLTTYYKKTIIWPVHPRTQKNLQSLGLILPKAIVQLPPLNYFDFIKLQKNAHLILTDSGGLQEEACILKVPCITLRENTERPETIEVGANRLVGLDPIKLQAAVNYFSEIKPQWNNPFGEGNTAIKIFDIALGKKTSQAYTLTTNPKTVSVIGLGYMGLPFACLLARAGHTVNGYDINKNRVQSIQNSISPFEETGMQELLTSVRSTNRFIASTELKPADVFIISVPTPVKDKKCDLSYVELAIEHLAKVVKNNDLVILESTVRPNTCSGVLKPFFDKLKVNVQIAFCPERAIPGQTIHELVHNDRIIGGLTPAATSQAHELYSSFVKGKIFTTTATTAEAVKLMENTFRDVNIALANEMSSLCKELGINVWEAIELANKHPRVNIHQPGPGVGGHCIALDPWFLIEHSDTSQLILTARHINDTRPRLIGQAVIEKLKGKNKVGLLGIAYKKNVDDCRETPAEHLVQFLNSKNIEVKYFDPYVPAWEIPNTKNVADLEAWADLMVLVTDHDDFKGLRLNKPLLDTRGFLDKSTL